MYNLHKDTQLPTLNLSFLNHQSRSLVMVKEQTFHNIKFIHFQNFSKKRMIQLTTP